MLGHCINEKCNRALHSFSEGRLFQFEIVSISLSASDEASAPFDEKPQREMAHFWLCGECASAYTLLLEPARGVRLVFFPEQDVWMSGDAAPASENIEAKQCGKRLRSRSTRLLGM